jgi:hypothetical protein
MSKGVGWAADSQATAIQDVGVNHRGTDIPMAQELLNRADIVTDLEQVGRKGVPQGVTMRRLGNTTRADGLPKCSLDDGLVEVVSPTLADDRVDIEPGRRKHPLPPPLSAGHRVLGGQRSRELDRSVTGRKIVIVQAMHDLEMDAQRSFERAGKHGHSIPIPLATSHPDFVRPKIEILDPQAQPLEEPEP